jgi:hypothetical protein
LILSKDIESFCNKFDFTEGIVTEIRWDSNLLDLLVVVYYYWDIRDGRKSNRELTIRLRNCREAIFTMPKVFENIPKDKLKTYTYSWYTVTHYLVENDSGLLNVSFKTVDANPRWLTAKCEEIWVEGEEL